VPVIEQQDFRKNRAIPSIYKSMLIIFCILGIFIHSYWNKQTVKTLVVDNETIMFEEINKQSLIVNFVIENRSNSEITEKIRVEVIDQDNILITSTIMYLKFKPEKNIFSEQIKYKRRFSDIDDRQLRALITVQPRKLLW